MINRRNAIKLASASVLGAALPQVAVGGILIDEQFTTQTSPQERLRMYFSPCDDPHLCNICVRGIPPVILDEVNAVTSYRIERCTVDIRQSWQNYVEKHGGGVYWCEDIDNPEIVSICVWPVGSSCSLAPPTGSTRIKEPLT